MSRGGVLAGSGSWVLALDVGGTKIARGVVSDLGRTELFSQMPTLVEQGPASCVSRLIAFGGEAIRKSPHAVSAVGVGCGGPLDPVAGIVVGPPNLPGWDNLPLARLLTEAFGLPVFLENDATAAALGEYRWGGHGDVRHLVYLTISTGIGGGIIIDGRPYRGATGNGCEPGHLVLDWQGRPCNCGQRGCAEAYVSGTAIARRGAEALTAGARSLLAGLPAVTAREIAAAASAGDPLAVRIWDETTAMLGRFVALVINAYEPQVVVLGGGVTHAAAMLLDAVRDAAIRQAMAPAGRAARIVLSRHGDRVGVLGAAAAAFDQMNGA